MKITIDIQDDMLKIIGKEPHELKKYCIDAISSQVYYDTGVELLKAIE